MMTSPRVLMWVQTRLGLGHLSRSLTLCGALAENGFSVTLAHGGPPAHGLAIPRGVAVAQLPIALSPNLDSNAIFDAAGQGVDDVWRRDRIDALKELILNFRPGIFMTETFPLGRWLFQFELLPVLDWLRAKPGRPKIVASVRDVLTRPSKDSKAAAMIATALSKYDLVLCHSDPNFLQLPESFPETAQLSAMTSYSGYVSAPPRKSAGKRSSVIVTAGGGAVGQKLFDAALGAKRLWSREPSNWTLVAGPRFDDASLRKLREAAPSGVSIEGAVEGLAERYSECALVVGQAGYNTVCEALSHGARLTVVPYATEKETEQAIRTKRFGDLGLIASVSPEHLTPRTLAMAMESALDASAPVRAIDFDGGAKSASILRNLLKDNAL